MAEHDSVGRFDKQNPIYCDYRPINRRRVALPLIFYGTAAENFRSPRESLPIASKSPFGPLPIVRKQHRHRDATVEKVTQKPVTRCWQEGN